MRFFNKDAVTKYINEALKIKRDEVIALYARGHYKIVNVKDFNPEDASIVHHIKGSKLNVYFNVPRKQLKGLGAGYIKKYPVNYNKIVNTVFIRANNAIMLTNA
jgi:hypothetical protein